MASSGRRVIVMTLLLASAGCAAPITQLGSVSREDVAMEELRQQQFVLQSALKERFRLLNVAYPLLLAGAPLCADNLRPLAAFVAGNAYLWKKDYFNAALALGYNDTLMVMNVTPELPAAAAGLRVGDRILEIGGASVTTGQRALQDFNSRISSAKGKLPKPFTLTYRRASDIARVTITPESACSFTPQVVDDDIIQASADGQSIFVTTGMLRFAADDNELAAIVGHELAHDAMHHMDAQKKNSLLGGLVGLLADVGMAAAGVDTRGEFTKQGMEAGAMVFSQDFEREADYVGLYVLALAGRPIDNVPNLWRRMAVANPGSIKFATTHPTTAERFVRLAQWRSEIGRKIAAGQPVLPELKKGSPALAARRGPGRPTSAGAAIVSNPTPRDRSATSLADPTSPAPLNAAKSESLVSVTEIPKQPTLAAPSAVERSMLTPISSDHAARSIIGAPESESARAAAIETFAQANAYVGSHEWTKAEQKFHETLRLDGSVAKYHAAFGRLMMLQQRWLEAQASYTAAVLLDLDNTEYKRLLKEARSHR